MIDKEYIERGAAINRLLSVAVTDDVFGMGIQFGVDHAIAVLSEVPAADVVEVVHGKWIEKVGRAKCSVCADECWADSAVEYRYCPNCGARMDGAEHD